MKLLMNLRKPHLEHYTLLFDVNSSGEHNLKPMMIYQTENPRPLKCCDKNKLSVLWRSSKRKERLDVGKNIL